LVLGIAILVGASIGSGFHQVLIAGVVILSLVLSFFVRPLALAELVVVSVPFFRYSIVKLSAVSSALGDVPVTGVHVFGILLIVRFLGDRLMSRGQLRLDNYTRCVLLIIGAYILSAIAVAQYYQGWIEYVKTLINVLFFSVLSLALRHAIDTTAKFYRVLRWWLLVAALTALYGLYQILSYSVSLPVLPGTEIKVYAGLPRVFSVMVEPAHFVSYLVYPLVVMIVLWESKEAFPFPRRWRNLLLGLGMLLAYLLSFALSGYLYLLLFFMLYIALGMITRRIGRGLRSVLLLLVVAGGFLANRGTTTVLLERANSAVGLSESSSLWRLNSMEVGVEEFLRSPLLGIGGGQFGFHQATGQLYDESQMGAAETAESTLVHIAAETGIVGLAGFAVLIITLTRALWKQLSRGLSIERSVSTAFLLMVCLYSMASIYTGGWLVGWVWVNFGLIASWLRLCSTSWNRHDFSDG
jgi:O-antigen ligase